MDIENGGRKGKPVIIVLPKHVKAAKTMFQDFEDLVKQHKSEALAVADGQSVTSGDSNPLEDDYMTQLKEMLVISSANDSDSEEEDSQSPPKWSQNNRSRKERSYAEVTRDAKMMTHVDTERQERWSESSLQKAAMEEKEIVTSEVMESTVSSMTLSPPPEMLTEIYKMMKDQQEHIWKMDKHYTKVQKQNKQLQTQFDFVCDAIEELSRQTNDSDLPSLASTIMSVHSGTSIDKPTADEPSRPGTITFSDSDQQVYDKERPPPPPPIDVSTTKMDTREEWQSPPHKHSGSPSKLNKVTPTSSLKTSNPFAALGKEDSGETESTTKLKSMEKVCSGQAQSPIKSPPKKVRWQMTGHGKEFQDCMEEVLAADGKESSGSVLLDEIEMDTDLIDDRTYWTSTGEGGVNEVFL